jgi:arylsulfatase A-like enzyme
MCLKQMDAVIGEIWTAIQKTPDAADTALVLVSDHGFNTDDKIYSQGYNLVKLLGSRAGGGPSRDHQAPSDARLLDQRR